MLLNFSLGINTQCPEFCFRSVWSVSQVTERTRVGSIILKKNDKKAKLNVAQYFGKL